MPIYTFEPELDDSVPWLMGDFTCPEHGPYVIVSRKDQRPAHCPKCVLTDRRVLIEYG